MAQTFKWFRVNFADTYGSSFVRAYTRNGAASGWAPREVTSVEVAPKASNDKLETTFADVIGDSPFVARRVADVLDMWQTR